MRASSLVPRVLFVAVAAACSLSLTEADDEQLVPFPTDYRSWFHVKSLVIGPSHRLFAGRGGIHHYYANDLAVIGYRTGTFPDGAIVVAEAVYAQEGEGPAQGALLEGGRRFLDVMVKDRNLYAQTGGWGFQHFKKEETQGALSAKEQMQCYECHSTAPDQVFSRIRP